MSKLKLLILTEKLNIGGYDLVAYNLAENLDKNKLDITFLVRGDEKGMLEDTVVKDGYKVIHQPSDTVSYLKSYFFLKRFLKKNRFDIVHSHLNFYSGIVMRAAYKRDVLVRASHAHFTDPCIENRSKITTVIANVYEAVMRLWFKRYCNLKIGCGYEAGCYLFGKRGFEKNGVLLNNGVDTKRFSYNEAVRNEKRVAMKLENKIVIGHCGRLNYVKNHRFLLEVFAEFCKEHSNAVLLLVGDGEQRENILLQAQQLGVADKVMITGLVKDTEIYYNVMDCFVFPSLHEGFPLTLVEAQATKLPCVISDNVTKAAKLNSNVLYYSLDSDVSAWSNGIERLLSQRRSDVSVDDLHQDFSVRSCAKKLEDLYFQLF